MKARYSGRKPSLIYPHIHVFDSLLPFWEDRQRQNGRLAERKGIIITVYFFCKTGGFESRTFHKDRKALPGMVNVNEQRLGDSAV